MTDNEKTAYAGDTLFAAFMEQVKQVLEHLYDFAYLQQHPLARIYDVEGDFSARTAGRQLRYEVIQVIEALKPHQDAHFRAPVARLYNILHLYYVENLTIQEAAAELGLSERQAYRDLKRGQESIAAELWNKRLLPAAQPEIIEDEFSLESELTRLKININPVDIAELFGQARLAVEKLAQQQSVNLVFENPPKPLMLSTDAVVANQIMVSILSYTVQQSQPGQVTVAFTADRSSVSLFLRYAVLMGVKTDTIFDSVTAKLAGRLHWKIESVDLPEQQRQITLHMKAGSSTVMVIDDNTGWTELLGRFLAGYDCLVVASSGDQDILQQVQELNPTLIILDVMMPGRDGWELLQRLRAQPATATMPIIVCTVFNDPQLAYSLGASAFVLKPASRETILESLKQFNVI